MVTRISVDRDYILQGKVVSRSSKRGAQGLRVEAWDRDTKYHDMLGQAVTDADGAFMIGFDTDYFGDYAPDRAPDVYYKVFAGESELLSTFAKPQQNVQRGRTQVTLEIDMALDAPTGKDYVTAEQAFKAVDWWQASDFRGVYTQGKDKAKTVGGLLGTLLGDALRDFDFEPVQPKSVREREIVKQTPDAARAALLQQQVEVTEVKQASVLGTADNAKDIADYPLTLKAGDRVTLYERNGVVAYYTLNEAAKSTADGETVARIDNDLQGMKSRMAGMDDMRTELANVKTANAEMAARAAEESTQSQAHAQEISRLQRQLEQVQQASAAKDVQITKLQGDLAQVTRTQEELAARLPLDRLNALELQLSRLNLTRPDTGGAVPRPVGKKAPTKSAATKASLKPAGAAAKKAAKPRKKDA